MAINNEAMSGVKRRKYRILLDWSVWRKHISRERDKNSVSDTPVLSAVQRIVQEHYPIQNQHNTTFVDA